MTAPTLTKASVEQAIADLRKALSTHDRTLAWDLCASADDIVRAIMATDWPMPGMTFTNVGLPYVDEVNARITSLVYYKNHVHLP